MGFFDGFFGLTNQGKAAQNSINGLTNDYRAQMQQLLQNAQQFKGNGDSLFNWGNQYWQGRAADGAPSIAGIRQNGESIMPFSDILGRMWGRQQNINNDWQNTGGKAWDVMPMLKNNLDLQQQNITNNSDFTQGQINDTYAGATDRENSTSGAVRDNINNTFNGARDIIGGAYGAARGDNAKTYADIVARTGNAYSDMRANAEKLRPGSQFQQAQTARSFAPAVAGAMGRLRRSGVDPNSMQAANVIGNVEAERARAQDDTAARGTADYVNTVNGLRAGELGATTNAQTARLNNEMNLGTTEAGMQGNLALNRGGQMNSEMLRNLSALTGLDLSKLQGTLANSTNTTNALNSNIADRSNADILGRQMQMQDFQTGAGLQRDENNLDMTGLNMLNQQWGMGSDWSKWDQGTRDQAAQQLMQMMQGQYNNSNTANGQAFQWGNAANQNLQQQYQQELARSGWGTRLLGGLAGAALGGVTGGFNPMSLFGGGGGGTGGGFNMSNSSYTGTPAILPTGSNGFGLYNNPFGGRP